MNLSTLSRYITGLVAHPDTAKAFKDALPITTAYFTVSMVFGWMCVEQGLPVWLPAIMSIFVYAGASQFAALAMLSAGATVVTIVLTTFLINMRHMLMSVYLSNALTRKQVTPKQRWFYAFGVTDETFAWQSRLLKKQHDNAQANGLLSARYLISFNVWCHLFWIAGTVLGAVLALMLSEAIKLDLEYALVALMLYILVALTDNWDKLLVAVVATMVMVVLNMIGQSYFNLFIATFVGCGVGVWYKTR